MVEEGLIDPLFDYWMDPPRQARFVIPFLPPSSNQIYVTDWRRKRKFKSAKAKAFEEEFRAKVVPRYLPWLSKLIGPEQDPSVIYAVAIDFYFPRKEVLNSSWGKGPANKQAKTRYKKMDTGNRLKLINDCLSEALQIDDSHFFQVGGRKLIAESFNVIPQAHIFLTQHGPDMFGA